MTTNNKNSLFVGDLSIFCSEKDLHERFSQFGDVIDVKIIRCEETSKNLAYGFVKFEAKSSAMEAAEALDGKILCGRAMRIRWASRKAQSESTSVSNSRISDTSSVHVLYSSQQIENVITDEMLRQVFEKYGTVVDVTVKKSEISHELSTQKGYGFVHFPVSAEGVSAAMKAVEELYDSVVNRIHFRCSLSHKLRQQMGGADPSKGPPFHRSHPNFDTGKHFKHGIRSQDSFNSVPTTSSPFVIPPSDNYSNSTMMYTPLFYYPYPMGMSPGRSEQQQYEYGKPLGTGSTDSVGSGSASNMFQFPPTTLVAPLLGENRPCSSLGQYGNPFSGTSNPLHFDYSTTENETIQVKDLLAPTATDPLIDSEVSQPSTRGSSLSNSTSHLLPTSNIGPRTTDPVLSQQISPSSEPTIALDSPPHVNIPASEALRAQQEGSMYMGSTQPCFFPVAQYPVNMMNTPPFRPYGVNSPLASYPFQNFMVPQGSQQVPGVANPYFFPFYGYPQQNMEMDGRHSVPRGGGWNHEFQGSMAGSYSGQQQNSYFNNRGFSQSAENVRGTLGFSYNQHQRRPTI